MRAPVRTGTVLAGFRVKSLVGEGAMGAVYLAEEISSGRREALKLLAPELAREERFRRRFLRESQLAASLDHPQIVRTVGTGGETRGPYPPMECVEGADLRQMFPLQGRSSPD